MEAYTQTVRTFQFRELTRAGAEIILGWRYPPPYDFYDGASVSEEAVAKLLRPENNYRAIDDQSGRLIGFFCWGPMPRSPDGDSDGDTTARFWILECRVPTLTGQGIGGNCLQEFLRHLEASASGVALALRASVAARNTARDSSLYRGGFSRSRLFHRALGSLV